MSRTVVRDTLLLMRAPLGASAASNLAVGLILCAPAAASPGAGALALLALSTCCLYWGGMVLNDYFDRGRDRTLHPERPIPAGRIAPARALALGVVLLAGGVAAAALAGWAAGGHALRGLAGGGGVAACVLAYDGLLKRRRLAGSLAMASCRLGNALLGCFALGLWGPDLEGGARQAPVLYALALGCYVLALTILSTYEDEDAPRAAVVGATLGMLAAPGALIGLSVARPAWSPLALVGAGPLVALLLVQARTTLRAGTRAAGRGATRVHLRGIWLLDLGAVLAVAPWPLAAVPLALFALGALSARLLFTPSREAAGGQARRSVPESERNPR